MSAWVFAKPKARIKSQGVLKVTTAVILFIHFTDRILNFVFWHSWHGGGHDSDKIRQTTWEFPLSLHLSIARLHHYDSLDWATRLVQKVKIFFLCVFMSPKWEGKCKGKKKQCWGELNYSQFLNFSFFLQKNKVYINIIFEMYIFQQMISILYFFPKMHGKWYCLDDE